jgi:hypothetical protein
MCSVAKKKIKNRNMRRLLLVVQAYSCITGCLPVLLLPHTQVVRRHSTAPSPPYHMCSVHLVFYAGGFIFAASISIISPSTPMSMLTLKWEVVQILNIYSAWWVDGFQHQKQCREMPCLFPLYISYHQQDLQLHSEYYCILEWNLPCFQSRKSMSRVLTQNNLAMEEGCFHFLHMLMVRLNGPVKNRVLTH